MNLSFTHFIGLVYRGHNPRWSFDPTSGDGAEIHGGRFNPKGTAALYTSTRPETAWLEAQQGFPYKTQPLTLCTYEVESADILDLTDPPTRNAVGTSLAELGCAWEEMASRGEPPPSWRIAERLIKAGCAGIMVPSFAHGATGRDINVIFWDWTETPPHKIRVVDDEDRLPKDDSSWR